MPIYGKYDNLFSPELLDLKTVSSTAKASLKYNPSPANFTFQNGVIADSKFPFAGSGLKLIASVAGDKVTNPTGESATAGSLTIELYDSETENGTTAFTHKIATYGPFTSATMENLCKLEFLEAGSPENAKAYIQVKVTGSAFASGKVWIRVGA